MRRTLSRLQLGFVPNEGQLDPRVGLYMRGASSGVYFTSHGVTLSASGPASLAGTPGADAWAVEQRFLNTGTPVTPVGMRRTTGVVSYFTGSADRWRGGLPTYSTVLYRDVWPGIDVEYSGTTGHLESTFIVHPGADPRDIALAYRGASDVRLDASGRLQVATPLGGFADQPPVAYQMVDGRRTPIPASFLTGSATGSSFGFGFRLGSYDPSRTLVIDPVSISYSGYIGGYLQDIGLAIAVDAAGNAYVVGQTNSSEATFPVKVGPFLHNDGQTDVFVCKVTTVGTLVYCGFIGGDSSDRARGVAVDAAGEAYVVGWTRSDSDKDRFPVKNGPGLTYFGGTSDAFIAKVSADGTTLLFCGYLGGSDHDEGKNVALDNSGNAYVTGGTKSTDWTQIPASGVAQPVAGGGGDAFVVEVSNAGQAVTGTYIGGACETHCGGGLEPAKKGGEHDGDDHARGIAVVPTGAAAGVYVDGDTHSKADTFDPVVGPSLTYGGEGDAFAARLPLDLSTFVYKGYLGGKKYEDLRDNAVDPQGNAYLCGHTSSTDFPIVGTLDGSLNGDSDGFVTKIGPSGTSLAFSGLIGGTSKDSCYGINVDPAHHVFIAGHTNSKFEFPVLNVGGYPDSLGVEYAGGGDGFVSEVAADGNSLVFSGYFGGYSSEVLWASDLNGNGDLVVTGTTHSSQNSNRPFPLKLGPDLYYNGAGDGIVALFDVGAG